MPGGPDPLGKRALYWMPVDAAPNSRDRARPPGKHALFSSAPVSGTGDGIPAMESEDPMPERGLFTVECSRCGGVTRIGLLDLVVLQFPVGVWLPRGAFDRRMTCPRCRRRSWVSLTLTR